MLLLVAKKTLAFADWVQLPFVIVVGGGIVELLRAVATAKLLRCNRLDSTAVFHFSLQLETTVVAVASDDHLVGLCSFSLDSIAEVARRSAAVQSS